MSDAQEILELIQSVSPDDTAKLREIDYFVSTFLTGLPVVAGLFYKSTTEIELSNGYKGPFTRRAQVPEYTRSRDALKAIRPEGWWFQISSARATMPEEMPLIYTCTARNYETGKELVVPWLRDEELAELNAIIQAIEYERTAN